MSGGRRIVVALMLAVAVAVSPAGPAGADPNDPPAQYQFNQFGPSQGDNVILKWDEELLQAVRARPPGPTVVARALAMLHTATYDAWAAYDPVARGYRFGGGLRRPPAERTLENKNKAISYAAFTVLVDLFPARADDFAKQMEELGYPTDGSDTSVPATLGGTVGSTEVAIRHKDGANQLGGYADTTGYQPVNTGDKVVDPWRWQPLRVPLGTGPEQKALTPQWGGVSSFALLSPSQGKPLPGPPRTPDGAFSTVDIDQALKDTDRLDDVAKIQAEYWADGPRSEFPPGHWALFAQWVSRKRGDGVDQDAKLFFALGNALLDASVAAWSAKYHYDFVRPITAIREQYRGKTVTSWLGPYKGYGQVPGERWIPYQDSNVVTPAFPEYISGHSTFSAAGAAVLRAFTGGDGFGASVTVRAGESRFEPRDPEHPVGTPASDVTLSWPTFSAAADDAGMSRRVGGIHFQSGDLHGRALGRTIGQNAWARAQLYWSAMTTN